MMSKAPMPLLTITECCNGTELTQYQQTVEITEHDSKNEIRLEVIMENGDVYFLPIPTSDWSEFVRHCQKLSTST